MAGDKYQDQNNQNDVKDAPNFQDIEHGPLNNNQRQCRDIICCILFLANIAVLAVIAIWSYIGGTPYKAFRATDKNKLVCGQTGTATADYPYAYFYNPLSMTNRICVKSCPKYVSGTLETASCFPNSGCSYTKTVAEDGTMSSAPTASDIVGYGSYSILGRICLPEMVVLQKAFSSYSSSLASSVDQTYLSKFITDIQNNWQYILAGFGFAVVIAFILMFLMRWIAPLLVWLSIIGIIIIFAGAGFIFLYNAGTFQQFGLQLGNLGIPTLAPNQYYNIYGYVSFGLALLFFLVFLCCCSRIRLAIAVCKVAGQFVIRVAQIMLVPIVMTALVLGLWAFGLSSLVYIISTAQFVATDDVFTSINDYTQRSLGMFYYFFFGILWTNAFLGAVSLFIVASSCCLWYFSRGPGDELSSPVLTSLYRIFRYHMGSLAFGALIIAVIQFIQAVVEVVKSQTVDQTENMIAKAIVCCVQCCLKCFEKIIQYINKQAYIQIALRGKNFCMASYDGITAVASNPARYGIISGVGSIMMFITQLMISAGATGIFYVLITFNANIRSNVSQPLFLLAVVFLGSFIIAIAFMSVYSIAMDTILGCFIADEQNQKGKSGKPLYAPEQMVELMDS